MYGFINNIIFTGKFKKVTAFAKKPQNIFLILGLFFGIIFIFRLAPLSGMDEFTHFPRLYQISEGIFWEQKLPGNQFGGLLPTNVKNMVDDYRNLSRFPTGSSYLTGTAQLNEKYSKINVPGSKKATAQFTSDVIYPPWAYLPSLIGLEIAKVFHLPLLWYVILARLSNLIIWLALTYLAIKILPEGKWFLVVVALLPTSLSQAATIGGDGLLIGLCWLLISSVLAVIAGKIKLKWPALILLLALAAYTALIKDGYFLVGLLPLAIPMRRFSSKTIAWVVKTADVLIVVAAALLFTERTVHTVNGTVLTPTAGMNINGKLQIHYITHHLLNFGWRIIEQPFTKTFDTTYLGIIGIMTNRLIYLSIFIIGLLALCLFWTYINSQPIKEFQNHYKLTIPVFVGIFYITYLLLASAFYIGNTSVGATFVNGFYGRYFLPIIPLLLIIPISLKKSIKTRHVKLPILGSLAGLIAMVLSIQ